MGFFFADIPKSKGQAAHAQKAATADRARLGCNGCTLNTVRMVNPKMGPEGSTKPLVYLLNDAPSAQDDEAGRHFEGKTGDLVRGEIPSELKSRVRFGNRVRCRSGKAPTNLEIACCNKLFTADIEATKPKLIIGFGSSTLKALTGKSQMKAWRGRMIPVKVGKHVCWYFAALHPYFDVLINRKDKERRQWEEAFRIDMRKAFARLEAGLPEPTVEENYHAGVECLYEADMEKVVERLSWFGMQADVGIDIETNGLRPFFPGRKILSVAISDYDKTFAFPIDHQEAKWTKEERKQLKAFFKGWLLGAAKKWAHNTKFEQEWLSEEFGDEIIWETSWGDTMAQAYVLDEREGAKGLEDLTTEYLGFDVKEQSPALNKNHLDDEPLERVLPYNALDAKYCYLVAMLQEERLKQEKLLKVYDAQQERCGPIVIAQRRGVIPNHEAIKGFYEKHHKEEQDCLRKMRAHPDVKKFEALHGVLTASPKSLLMFFKDYLGMEKECKIGENYSTDESVLKNIKHPVAKAVLELRAVSKLQSTYVVPLMQGQALNGEKNWGEALHDDGRVHTNFNHCKTGTRRLSSDEPNLQNFPKRKGKELRRVIKAPPGYLMASIDYGQIEARVIGMASKDHFLMKALWENYDIHKVWAEKIGNEFPQVVGGRKFLKDPDAFKKWRNTIKNGWTFPLFFGSVLPSVANGLGVDIKRLEPYFDEFWDTFADVKQWQESLLRGYRRDGYVQTLTGFRRRGPLTPNEIINTPVQGTASDIVVDAMCRLARKARDEQKPHLHPRINIHDDLTFYFPERRVEDTIYEAAEVMCCTPLEFVTVPITVEASIGETWADQEEVAVFSDIDFGFKRSAARETAA
jgi:uracil-DNA glycosylase family 4